MPIKNIGVLISGGGTNLQSLIDAINAGQINGRISVVISNKKYAYGLERARKNGIDAIYLEPRSFDNSINFNKAILKKLKERKVDLVVLAGYLNILGQEIVEEYEGKIINIHPSLIPSFCGKGFYGERVHRAVLDRGVKVTGATVHLVDRGVDTGPIIFQEAVRIDNNDTLDTLKNKVLKIEHKILAEAVKLFCQEDIEWEIAVSKK